MSGVAAFALALWGSIEAAGAVCAYRCRERGPAILGGALAVGLLASAAGTALLP